MDEEMTLKEAELFFEQLHRENEEKMTDCILEIKQLEQKLREAEYVEKEEEEEQDLSISLFSPVGVLNEKSRADNQEKVEEIKNQLELQQERLKQIRYRHEQLPRMKEKLLEAQKKGEEKQSFWQMEEEGLGGSSAGVMAQEGAELSERERCIVEDQIRALHILETQEYDRNRIARDLHDSSVQSLTNLVHKSEFCMRLLDVDNVRVKLELQSMIESIRTVINGMREIIYDLRPMSLNDYSLTGMIETYCLQLKNNLSFEIALDLPKEEPKLLQIRSITLFRIVQEALNNIIKHAKADNVAIQVAYVDGKVHMKIQDDGVGFAIEEMEAEAEKCCKKLDPARYEEQCFSDTETEKNELHGFGISIMKERVSLLGGAIRINSKQGEGTTVEVEAPIKYEREKNDGED